MPGDRLRRVNWPVTSRTGRLHVTETFLERDTDVLVVTDTVVLVPGAPLPSGDSEASSLDSAVRATAAVAMHYATFGDRVAVHDLGRAIGPVPAGSGPRQTRVILDHLARVDRTRHRDRTVRQVASLAAGTLVFFCSPLLESGVVDELVRLRRLGGEVVGIDTLPPGLGHEPLPGRDADRLAEGWTMRRIDHDTTIDRLRAAGIPVTPWRGPGSLGPILLAMEQARSAPRLRGRR